MSDPSLHLLRAIRQRLRVAMRRQTAAEVALGLAVTLGVLGAVSLVAVAAEAEWWMGLGVRQVLFWAFVAGAAGLLARLVGLPILRFTGLLGGLDERSVAKRAGTRHPAVADRLTALLDLADGRASQAPSAMLDGAVQMLSREVEPVPFERVEDVRPVRRAAGWAIGPLLGLLAFFLAAPGPFVGAVDRLLSPYEQFQPPAPFGFRVLPGDVELTRGDSLTVVATPFGRGWPGLATLEVGRADERATDDVRLVLGRDGRFEHTVPAVAQSLRYRVVADGVSSAWFTATVVARPVVRGLQVVVVPPGHTGLPLRRLAPGAGDVTGLPGTAVRVRVEAGGVPIRRAELVLEERGRPPRTVLLALDADGEGAVATGAFALRAEGFWSVRLVSENGVRNAEPVRYALGVLRDAPPRIALTVGADGAIPATGTHDLRAQISDDFGFSRLALVARRVAADGTRGSIRSAAIRIPRPHVVEQEVDYAWAVRRAIPGLQPGDAVEFYLEVRDNDASGAKAARTPLFTLRLPSTTERFESLDQTEETVVEEMEGLRERASEAEELFEELRDALRRDQTVDFEDRRQLERLQQQHEQISEGAQTLAEQMREMRDEVEENRLAGEQTQQMVEAMEEVIGEIESPELREALERLREAMEQMDVPQMLQQLEQVEQQQESLEERIERALALMERIQTALEMDEMAQRAEALAEREEALQRETEALEREEAEDGPQQAEREALAAEQQAAREEMQALEREMDELEDRLEQTPNAPNEAMEQMQEQLDQQAIPQQMQQNAGQMQQGQMQRAQQGQQQMQQQLRQMAQQMRQMGEQMMQQQRQVDLAGLRRALDDVLTLSSEEEALAARTAALPTRSPALRPIARQQSELRAGLTTVTDSLRVIARSIPQLGAAVSGLADDAEREMTQSIEQLADGAAGPAAGHQRTAMTHLNDLALLLSEIMAQASQSQGSGSGGGMQSLMQGLQQMGEGQQGLNGEIQRRLGQTAGQRLQQGQGERAAQQAAQQEALQRQLEELIRGNGALGPQDRSNLRRVADEMEDAARALRQGALDRPAIERQERILSRLLEARRSLQERGREERREAQTGRARPPEARPGAVPPRTPDTRLRQDLLRALESGYAPDFQTLIQRYYERLRTRLGE